MRRQYVDTDLGQLHVYTAGAGTPLLLLGSAGRSARVFSYLIPLLSDHFQLIAPDLFGNGNSDALPVDATITSMAGCMTQLLDAYDIERVHVYGFHTGNKIGAALAANWPSRVDKLILAGQSHSIIPSNEERNRIIGGRTLEYFETPDDSSSISKALSSWAKLQRQVNALWWPDALFSSSADRLQALAHARTLVMDELQSFDSTSTLYRMNFAYDFMADLIRIKAQTLVLEISTPDEDKKLGRQGPKMCALLSNASLQDLEADGFRLTLEDKASELARILRQFLTAPNC
jgi:pimeloyl-ACP methyl ester carboxylesterase